MKRKTPLIILNTADDIAKLFGEDPEFIRHLVAQGIHPLWVWRRRMSQPRWPDSSIPEWKQILDQVKANPNGNPILPEHPSQMFCDPGKGRPARAATQSGPSEKNA